MHAHIPAALAALLALGTTPGLRAAAVPDLDSPVGRWQLIDDETHAARGVMELTRNGDELQGRFVEAYLQPGEQPHALCVKCSGERHNQPMVGMVILWGLHREGSEWVGGHILDPTQGRIYGASVTLADGGRRLRVRGYLGISLLGRTQFWNRMP
ncbi:MAG: DUF2147 domain-containing protein [Proteobacteria bacterium]|nr:DUF2147 domain-containing protein [Pseudomonadota bacterium]